MNIDYNRREQIIFGQDLDPQNDTHFEKEHALARESGQDTTEVFTQFYVGGIKKFETLKLFQLKTLLKEGFMEEDECGGNAPTIKNFLKFAESFQEKEPEATIYFTGFAEDPSRRENCRVAITGIKFTSRYAIDRDSLNSFWKFINTADEVEVCDREGFGWWD